MSLRVTDPPDCPHSISVIVPVYNEAGTIAGVVQQILAFTGSVPTVDWEVIVVNDGSTDATAEELSRLQGIMVLIHPENRGYGAAMKTGIHQAAGEHVLLMDSDGQHIARESIKLIEGGAQYAMTIGCRGNQGSQLTRLCGKWLLGRVANWLIQTKVPDVNSGHRLIHRATILKYIHVCSNRFSFSLSSTIALLTEGHFVRYVDIKTLPRQGSQSQVSISSGLSALLQIFRLAVVFHPLRLFLPLSCGAFSLMLVSLAIDFGNQNISDTSLFFLMIFVITGCFGFLSDQLSHIRREMNSRM